MKALLIAFTLAAGAWGQTGFHGSLIFDSYTGVAVLNDGSTGTTVNFLAKRGTTANTAVVSTTSDTKSNIGCVISGAGTTGYAWIATGGANVPCAFDGSVTANHYAIASTTAGGKLHDTGAATYPTSGVQVLGRILETQTGAGTYLVDMTERQESTAGAGGGATIAPVTNVICGDGGGNGSDCGFASTAVVQNNATNTAGTSKVEDDRVAAHTLPFKTGLFSAIPGTCTVGEKFFATDKTPPSYDCTATNTWTLGGGVTSNIRVIGVHFDGGGSALSGTITRCGKAKFSGTIIGGSLSADQSGSATVDVLTVADASYTGPGAASSITASAPLAISSAVKQDYTALVGWTTALAANTRVCLTLSSPATITWLDAQIQVAVN